MSDSARDIPATLKSVWDTLVEAGSDPGATVRPPVAPAPTDAPALRTSSIVFSETVAETPEPAGGAARIEMDFEVLRVLGRGGMGVVYAARQAALEREVALKTPVGVEPGQASLEQRFVAEAIVTAGLDHPNVVPVHELGRDVHGNLYMAMKLVQGRPWSSVLHQEAGAPPLLRDQLETLLRVSDAVAFAHARGVVHRDLKPANVMIGGFGEVLVMDWGLALPFGEAPSARLAGAPRVSAGTPSYMAPEMALGLLERVGPASDVYLLGAILYEILTGTPPHPGHSVWETLAAAALGEVEPPETRAPGRRIPRELSKIALRALAKDPGERPTVPALQAEIRSFLGHEESLRLSDEAAALAEQLAAPGAVALGERYTRLGEAQAGFRQALHLWDGNEHARTGLARVTERFAAEALDRGDVGLAAAQLGALAGMPRPEESRRDELAHAVRRRLDARRRTRLAAALVVVALGAVAWQVSDFRTAERRRAAARSHERRLEVALDDAWKRIHEGDVAALTRALVHVDALGQAPEGASGDWRRSFDLRTGWFPWVRQVLVWQQGRWDEVTMVEPPHAAGAAPAAPRRAPGAVVDDLLASAGPPATLCERLQRRAEVASSALGRRLAAACVPGRSLRPETVWPLLLEHARAGDTRGIDAADEELTASCATPGGCGDTAGAILIRSAVWALARDAAAARGDAGAARAAAERVLPFALTRVPFGGRDPHPRPAAAPRLVRQDATWLGLDPATGERLWQSPPVSSQVAGPPVPVEEDGSLVVAGDAQLVRLSGATGDVLGRVLLEAPVQGAWPDPRDRSRLVVLAGRPERSLREIGLGGGRPAPAAPVSASAAWPSAGWRAAMYKEAAGAWLGLGEPGLSPKRRGDRGKQAEQDPRGRAFVAERLRRLAGRDPSHPFGFVGLLKVLEPSDRRGAAAHAVEAARGLPVRWMAQVALQLEELGLTEEADTLWGLAAARFAAGYGNADLAWSGFGPAYFPRVAAARAASAGRHARAAELVEVSRRFATFLPGDESLNRRYALWLGREGRPEEARRVEARRDEARPFRSTPLQPDRFLLVLDIGLLTFAAVPPILAVLLARSWWRSRATRNADLHARGWRTAGQRAGAFLTHPVERLGFVFLRYSPRWERALVVVAGGALLYYVCLLVGGFATLGRVFAEPFDAAGGQLGTAEAVDVLRANAGGQVDRPFALRVLAEAHRGRGDHPGAAAALQRALARQADDTVALNNLAVLAEEAGRAAEAKDRYARAAASPAARFNLARLAGDPAALDRARVELPHRDALRAAQQGEAGPLWALVPAADYLDTVFPERTLADGAWAAFREILTTSPARAIFQVTNVEQFQVASQLLVGVTAAAYAVWLFTLLALLWLPFAARPVAPDPPTRRTPSRWRRVAGRVGLVVGLALPGSADLVAGQAAFGATVLLAFLLASFVSVCVFEGGLLWNQLGLATTVGGSEALFPGVEPGLAYPDLVALGAGAAALGAVLLTANAVLVWRRWRGGVS